MEDYVRIFEDIKEIRKGNRDEPLMRLELKEYKKMTGKIALLANSTRPDLSFTALPIAKRNNYATISDLRNFNSVLKNVREKDSRICFSKISKRENLKIIRISDTS